MSSLWKEIYCLRIMLYPDPPWLRLLTHPINKGHRIFVVFLLTCLKEGKKKKKINLGFRWFCCSLACDSWSAVRGELTFISVPFLSGFPHVSLSTFGVRFASSAPSVQRGSPTSHEIRITKDAFRVTCVGFWRNGATEKSSVFEMTDYNTTRTRSSTKTTARPFTLPVPRSHCARFMTTERSRLVNMYSLLLLEICCTVFLFFFPSPRQELSLPLCYRLANLWKPSRTESEPGFTGITSCLRHRGFS